MKRIFTKNAQVLQDPMMSPAQDPMAMPETEQPLEDPAQTSSPQEQDLVFEKGSDLDAFLSSGDRTAVQKQIEDKVAHADLEALREALEQYYTADDPGIREEIAGQIVKSGILPVGMVSPDSQEGMMATEYKEIDPKEIEAFVKDVDSQIKKMASSNLPVNKSFNLSKQAQAQTSQNIIMYGPGQTRIDPFTRQPVSDWSVVERNKGFGLVVDNVWNIDWESIWRGSIMDKYSRPYRDKDGNWVGGYINKRFEVDRWTPEGNNYQLLPGERRKPYLPEYRSTEARLEAMREKQAEEKGYEPESSGQPFNWKKASVKTAQANMTPSPQSKEELFQKQIKDYVDHCQEESNAKEFLNEQTSMTPSEIAFDVMGLEEDSFASERASSSAAEQPHLQHLDDDSLAREIYKEVLKFVQQSIDQYKESLPSMSDLKGAADDDRLHEQMDMDRQASFNLKKKTSS